MSCLVCGQKRLIEGLGLNWLDLGTGRKREGVIGIQNINVH